MTGKLQVEGDLAFLMQIAALTARAPPSSGARSRRGTTKSAVRLPDGTPRKPERPPARLVADRLD